MAIVVLYVFVDNRKLLTFVLFMASSVFVGFSIIVRTRWQNIVMTPLIISPLALVIIRYTLENGEPAGILDPSTQSWALMFGDPFYIPLALLAASFAWPGNYEEQGWYGGARWYWASLGAGIGVSVFWNLVLDAPNYVKSGHGDLLLSPSHLWHGWVVFPVLTGALINYGVPVIVRWWRSRATLLFIVAMLGYTSLSVADATVHPLDVTHLHPPVSQTWLANN